MTERSVHKNADTSDTNLSRHSISRVGLLEPAEIRSLASKLIAYGYDTVGNDKKAFRFKGLTEVLVEQYLNGNKAAVVEALTEVASEAPPIWKNSTYRFVFMEFFYTHGELDAMENAIMRRPMYEAGSGANPCQGLFELWEKPTATDIASRLFRIATQAQHLSTRDEAWSRLSLIEERRKVKRSEAVKAIGRVRAESPLMDYLITQREDQREIGGVFGSLCLDDKFVTLDGLWNHAGSLSEKALVICLAQQPNITELRSERHSQPSKEGIKNWLGQISKSKEPLTATMAEWATSRPKNSFANARDCLVYVASKVGKEFKTELFESLASFGPRGSHSA